MTNLLHWSLSQEIYRIGHISSTDWSVLFCECDNCPHKKKTLQTQHPPRNVFVRKYWLWLDGWSEHMICIVYLFWFAAPLFMPNCNQAFENLWNKKTKPKNKQKTKEKSNEMINQVRASIKLPGSVEINWNEKHNCTSVLSCERKRMPEKE